MPRDLTAFFNPKSIAVVGASRKKEKVGSIILRNIIDGFGGKIIPVNPHASKLFGLPVVPTVAELPPVDLAIVVLPAELVNSQVTLLADIGVKNIVVISAGFKEIGPDGEKLESELVSIVKEKGLNLLGPNCLGFVNNTIGLNAAFGQPVKKKGNLRFVSQSGALASAIFDWSEETSIGFAEFITLGNKADINELDVLEYFDNNDDPGLNKTDKRGLSENFPIGMYVESVADGTRFIDVTTKITSKNPLFAIKPGRTEAGVTAIKSHTGSLAGEDSIFDVVAEQCGVIRCYTLQDFFDCAKAFSWEDIPAGPKVGIVSNAGGPAVIASDLIIESGLELSVIEESTKSSLHKVLPREASILNPIDLLGDALAERYGRASEILIEETDSNVLLVLLTPQLMTQVEKTAQYITYLSEKYKKPIFCSFIGGSKISLGEEVLNKHRVPNFRYPERAVYALSQLLRYKRYRDVLGEENFQATKDGIVELNQELGDTVRGIIQEAVNQRYPTLDNISAETVLGSVGIMSPPSRYVASEQEAVDFANEYGWPVVLKLSGHGLAHKKDLGGVITDIMTEESMYDSFHKLERAIEQSDHLSKSSFQIQVQREVIGGLEAIVGLKYDAVFGHVLMFGAGGSYVELIKDVNLHLLPVNKKQIRGLIEKSRIFPILHGKGTKPEYPISKLEDLILRFTKLVSIIPEALDIEINPVIVTLNDVWAVDTKIFMKPTVPVPVSAKSSGPQLKMATAKSCKNLASKFYQFEVETEDPFIFEPGQYISIKVAPDAIRAYSIATKLNDTNFDLLVDTRPGGPGSKFFENLKPGDKIPFLGPFGVFTYKKEDSADRLVFLATGSGCSAVRCMIDHALYEDKCTKPIHLYFGLTYSYEVFWKDHFDKLAEEFPNFKYKIALFKPDESWGGECGFITKCMQDDFVEFGDCAAYLCGHRSMISDATDILLAKGCPKERIYTERFV